MSDTQGYGMRDAIGLRDAGLAEMQEVVKIEFENVVSSFENVMMKMWDVNQINK